MKTTHVVMDLDDRHRLVVTGYHTYDNLPVTHWTIEERHGSGWLGRKFLTRAKYVPHAVAQLGLGEIAVKAAQSWAAHSDLANV